MIFWIGLKTDGDRDAFEHEPVLFHETMEALRPGPGKRFIDGTLGGGGHTAGLLQAGAEVLGLDRDFAALEAVERRLGDAGGRFKGMQGDFGGMAEAAERAGWETVDGILLDLGVSSHQLDTAGRGFSFLREGPLDMRMDTGQSLSAREVVNEWDEEELSRALWEFGEERQARRIARAIVRERQERPFETTSDLAVLVERVQPRRGDRKHPATRTFQAIRMVVNRELDSLREALEAAPALLKAGGRLAVITFHSLEDRIVKHGLRAASEEWLDRPEWPEPRRNPGCVFRLITRKPVEAPAEEVGRNPRARSAKLRIAERREDR